MKSDPYEEIQITKAEALSIQAKQIEHYSKFHGEWVRGVVEGATRANELADGRHPIRVVNQYIPRGGKIEHLIQMHLQKMNETA